MFQNFQMNGTSEVNLKIFFYDIFYGILVQKLFCPTVRKNKIEGTPILKLAMVKR